MNDDEKLRIKNSFDGCLIYGTKEFNELTGRNKLENPETEQFTDFFIDPKTKMLKEKMAEYRNCPICGCDENELIFVKGGFRHVRCQCEFIYVNPTAQDKFREEFFRDIYHSWTEVLLTEEQIKIDNIKFEYGLNIIEPYKNAKGLLVDIGAGTGQFLKIARDRGWGVCGIEFNKKAVEQIQSLGIDVVDKPLEDSTLEETSVDVITLWEVLEHINDINGFMTNVSCILKSGGLLFICVPNINALVTRVLHEKSGTFAGYSHVNFFSIDSLGSLCEKHGFKILETDTIISEIGTIKNHLCYQDSYSGDANLPLDFLTPEYLYDNNLGSRIIILCRKD